MPAAFSMAVAPREMVPAPGRRWRRLGCDPRLSEQRQDPARRVAGFNFHDRMDKPRDERSFYGQRCLLPAMLIIAAASRDFRISRLERLHLYQVAALKTVPRRRGNQEFISTMCLHSYHRYLNRPAIDEQRVSCFDQTARRHSARLNHRRNSLKSSALHRDFLPVPMQGFF
jgi:hypothetical protein